MAVAVAWEFGIAKKTPKTKKEKHFGFPKHDTQSH